MIRIFSQMHRTDKYLQNSSVIWPSLTKCLMNLVIVSLSPVAATKNSELAPASRKEFFDIQPTIECGFTLKRCMIRT